MLAIERLDRPELFLGKTDWPLAAVQSADIGDHIFRDGWDKSKIVRPL